MSNMAPNNTAQYPPRHSSYLNQRDSVWESTVPAAEGADARYRVQNYMHGVYYLPHPAPNAREGETWMDFLADPQTSRPQNTANPSYLQPAPQSYSSPYALPAQPPLPSGSSSPRGSDRKRRLTTADGPMRRPSSIRMHSTNLGSSTANSTGLDSSPVAAQPPLPPPPAPPANPATPRNPSEFVTPRWQPDAAVSHCPVCGRTFTFLYRKHHCRKCGRVVCASCSPHRITIPRQFIVQPPSDGPANVIDLTRDDNESYMSPFVPLRNPALGGGEEVRVCNPCVPGPNYGPPPQYTPSVPSRHPTLALNQHFLPRPPTHRTHHSSSSIQDASRTVGHGQMQRSHNSASDNRRRGHHGGLTAGERWLPPLPSSHTQAAPFLPAPFNSSTSRHILPNNGRPSFDGGPGSQPISSMFSHSAFPGGPPDIMPPPQQRQQRRKIAEEDECPICGHELPPKALNGDETLREQHIQECLALHSAFPIPTPQSHQTSTSLPTRRTRGMSTVSEASSSRMAHAARGMFQFTATEKDCINADGEEEECIICFEEYQAGDKMARLVCWCKFHEKCISDWWGKKGRGACPTHQLHE